ncbi:hypothetical protein WME77_19160 [Sorangium sp. So ce764]|uniref:hypothetical protein n=1 Tax=Sorangium sp. So ce764 TaxID=3133320 RepID=UPI003F5EF2F8
MYEATILEEREHEVDVEINLRHGRGPQKETLDRKRVHATWTAAAKLLSKQEAIFDRKRVTAAVGDNLAALYPSILLPFADTVVSSNPLRAGEPKVVFSAPSNAWGEERNPQKIIQIVGSIWEDVRHLFAILSVLAHASDYAKKLIGKYVVVEARNMLDCLKQLREVDQRYDAPFAALQASLTKIDKRFPWETIRNKVGAHRDIRIDVVDATGFWRHITRFKIRQVLTLFQRHFETELYRLYPREVRASFALPCPVPHLVSSSATSEDDYESFDGTR